MSSAPERRQQDMPHALEIRRTDGESITDREHREVRILVAGDASLTVTWSRYGHGERGPDLHVHRRHTDAFYILAGTLTYALGPEGEREVRAPAGTVVVVPPSVAHAFRNDEPDDAVFLNVHTPDEGFAQYMRDLRDGRPAHFDSYDLPVDGQRPAADAVVAEGRYEGDDLVLVAKPDGIDVAIPGSGAALRFVD
jgi:mannose-6-phosphate isomerase-like protein (cupin superfamily)